MTRQCILLALICLCVVGLVTGCATNQNDSSMIWRVLIGLAEGDPEFSDQNVTDSAAQNLADVFESMEQPPIKARQDGLAVVIEKD